MFSPPWTPSHHCTHIHLSDETANYRHWTLTMSLTALRINTNDSFVAWASAPQEKKQQKKKKQIPIWNEAEGWLEVNVRGKLWKIIWRSVGVKVVDWHLCWSWAITWTLLTGTAGQPLKYLSSRRAIRPQRSSNLHRCAEELSSKPTGNGYFQPLVFGVQCDEMNLKIQDGIKVKKGFFRTSLKIRSLFEPQGACCLWWRLLCFHCRTLEASDFT